MQSENYELDMFNLLQGHTINLNKVKPQTCSNSGSKQFERFKPAGGGNDLLRLEKEMNQLKLPSIQKNTAMVHLPSIFNPTLSSPASQRMDD
jgi:hypothetical protein